MKSDFIFFLQVNKLNRQLSVGHDKAFEEIQLRNKFLTERLEELEKLALHRSQNVVCICYKEEIQKNF